MSQIEMKAGDTVEVGLQKIADDVAIEQSHGFGFRNLICESMLPRPRQRTGCISSQHRNSQLGNRNFHDRT